MNRIVAIPLPLPHVRSVNAWLLRGDPVTLIDTGPRADGALAALEEGLRREGLRVEDIELLLATHHHLDHVGLAATIQRRSGAAVAVLDRTADYAARYAAEVDEDRRFARSLMGHHGVPEQLVADTESFWQYIRDTTEDFRADVRLADGDVVRAGGRRLRVVARPGHSTTDTLFVDDRDAVAFAGDHLLATISSNTEICPPDRAPDGRARSRLRYLEGLEHTRSMPLTRLLTGHGAPVTEHGRLVAARLRDHRRRCERILARPRRRPRHGVRDRRPPVARADGDRAAAARRLGGGRQPRAAARGRRCRRAHRRRRVGVRADPRGPRGPTRERAAPPAAAPPRTRLRGTPVNRSDLDNGRGPFDLSGRVALVTGGTRGLGLAIARAFASAGADVMVASRKADACLQVAAELRATGARAIGHACHVGRWDEVERLVEAAYDEFGRVDVLVNNAGVSPLYATLGEVTEELFDKVIAVNLKGPFRLCALVGERMVADDGGSIINVSSTGAVRPTGDIVPYAAAKAGLNALTVGVAHALGPEGARQRDHARPVPHDDLRGLGHGRCWPSARARSRCAGRGSRTRSSARPCTWPPTPRASRPARSSRSTAALSGACRARDQTAVTSPPLGLSVAPT